MLPSMFGMGGSEILVILIVALLFLGPDKLPGAAKQISKGIRDIKKQSRALQQQIEGDEQIGGAIRDLKSALRGDDVPVKPKPIKPKKPKQLPPAEGTSLESPNATSAEASGDQAMNASTDAAGEPSILPPAAETSPETGPSALSIAAAIAAEAPVAPAMEAGPSVRLPPVAGEADADAPVSSPDDDEALASMIKPAAGTIAKGSEPKHG